MQALRNKSKVKEKKEKESKVKRVALKLILSNGDTFPVFESDIIEFEKRYQGVDVRKEFLNMKNWLELNPAKRRSFSQTRRFVETWLRKSAEGVSENGQESGILIRAKFLPISRRHHRLTQTAKSMQSIREMSQTVFEGELTGYNCEKCKNRGFSQRIRYDEYYKRWELVTVVCDCVELRKKIALGT